MSLDEITLEEIEILGSRIRQVSPPIIIKINDEYKNDLLEKIKRLGKEYGANNFFKGNELAVLEREPIPAFECLSGTCEYDKVFYIYLPVVFYKASK